MNIKSKDISFVVQGAICPDTKKILIELRKNLKDAEIILSTYKGSDISDLEYDKVVLNDDPGNTSADLYDKRYDNTNRQIVTTQGGIKQASRKYIFKTRTDLYIKGDKFLKYYNGLSKIKNNEWKAFDKKVLVLNVFTKHFIEQKGRKKYMSPFLVSDWIQFGKSEDIKRIWQDLALQIQPEFSRYFEDKPIRLPYAFGTRTWRFCPEQYIFYNYFHKINPKKVYMEHLLDLNDEIVRLSEEYIKNNFIILSPDKIPLAHAKHDCMLAQKEIKSGAMYKSDELLSDKIKKFIYSKTKEGNKRTVKIFGIKFHYKKRKKDYFKVPLQNVKMVEIEISSFCNRKCWFCPNSQVDRFSKNIFMDENLYLKALNELKSVNYKGTISYSRYNEPTANKELFLKRLKQAKELLPNAKLHTNTNGDYLTKEYIDELDKIGGLNSLSIQCYLKQDEEFDKDKILKRIDDMAKKLDLKYKIDFIKDDWIQATLEHENINIKMRARDFRQNGNNRAGSLKTIEKIKRTCPCRVPFIDIYIDYEGSIMPCCNFRHDIKEHKKFIMGNLNKNTLSEIYNGEKMISLRKKLDKKFIKIYPCNECNFIKG